MRRLATLGLTVALACMPATRAAAANGPAPDPNQKPPATSFDSLSGWHVSVEPLVELLRLGAERKSSMVGPEHSQVRLDLLNLGVGLAVAFKPPWRYWRANVRTSNGTPGEKQYLGFSLFTVLRLGSVSGATHGSILDNAAIGLGLTLDLLEAVSFGIGVDLYQGIKPDSGRRFDTGILPALFGTGQMTREDVFFTISFNFVSLVKRFQATNTGANQ
jgi:hypothetical protein